MPVLPCVSNSGPEMVWQILKYALTPANGYSGSLLIDQFRVGLVPDEVQNRYPTQGYGSLYNSTSRSLEDRVSSDDPTEPPTDLGEERVQVSIWAPRQDKAGQVGHEVRRLIKSIQIPVIFPETIIGDVIAADGMTVQEETHVWHHVFDVRLVTQE